MIFSSKIRRRRRRRVDSSKPLLSLARFSLSEVVRKIPELHLVQVLQYQVLDFLLSACMRVCLIAVDLCQPNDLNWGTAPQPKFHDELHPCWIAWQDICFISFAFYFLAYFNLVIYATPHNSGKKILAGFLSFITTFSMRKKNKNLHRYVVGTEPGHHHNFFVLDMVDRNDVNNLAGRKKMFNWFYFCIQGV